MVIAAERIAGVHSFAATIDPSDRPEAEASGTTVNLLWGNASTSDGSVNPYAIPHLSVHGILPGGVTLGGSLGFVSITGERDVWVSGAFGEDERTTSRDLPTSTILVVAPRIGFLIPTSDTVAFWLRGGLTHYVVDTHAEDEDPDVDFETSITESGLAFSLDPMLVLSPVPHVGILLGPVFDIGLSGTVKIDYGGTDSPPEDPEDIDVTLSSYGAAVGVAIFL